MREVFVNQDSARVGFYKTVLDQAGIPNFVRNMNGNSMTELPSPIFFPTLCVTRDEDYAEAMRILGEIHYAKPAEGPDWKCAKCDEDVPSTFDSCWHCGEARDIAP